MLAITGMGLISAVGRDVASSCASLRAGISRARGLLSYQVLNADDQEPMPVRACPVHGFTEGFQHLGLWVRLASAALSDMIQFSGLPGSGAGSWYGTALAVVAPLLNQHRFDGAELLSDSLFESYILPAARNSGLATSRDLAEWIPAGHAGAAIAIERASAQITRGVPRVIVLAADSYCDPLTLGWLHSLGRLKTPDNPVGCVPGEAAACLLLESVESARRRGAHIFAVIGGCATASEPDHWMSGKRSQGRGLAAAIENALSQASGTPFSGDLLSDMNGEEWRAYELGSARVRLQSQFDPSRILYPAVSFGETGAASGIAAICAAARSLERRYASGSAALVASSSDNESRGATYLTC